MSLDAEAIKRIGELAGQADISVKEGKIRRTSSRFCLGVEHGDYNGTELFGVGTDRFIWMGYRANESKRIRLFSGNFAAEGVVEFELGEGPGPKSAELADKWARFAYGVEYILRREGLRIEKGIDGVIHGNIPGGGMSRSASLTLNLILSLLDANEIEIRDPFKIVEMAQAVENDYIGSPCGQLDQIMILLAKEGMGTHYDPKAKSVSYEPLGEARSDFRIVILDTGTVRPGLEKSTYKIRTAECEELVGILQRSGYKVSCLADIREQAVFESIMEQFGGERPELCKRLRYIFCAQQRFNQMLVAWKEGDIETVGELFRQDGFGLRDEYQISGTELETMCDIARGVKGVLGERMLGGGDKGASGAFVLAESVQELRRAVDEEYPRRCPEYANKYQVHECALVDGVTVHEGVLG